MPGKFRMAAGLVLSALLAACHSMRPMEDWQTGLKRGDMVEIRKINQLEPTRMRITAVTADTIEGRPRWHPGTPSSAIQMNEVAEVEIRRISLLKTALLVSTGLLLGLGIVGLPMPGE